MRSHRLGTAQACVRQTGLRRARFSVCPAYSHDQGTSPGQRGRDPPMGCIADESVSRMSKRALSKFGAAVLVIGLIVAGYIVIDQMGRDRARAAAARPTPAVPVTVT